MLLNSTALNQGTLNGASFQTAFANVSSTQMQSASTSSNLIVTGQVSLNQVQQGAVSTVPRYTIKSEQAQEGSVNISWVMPAFVASAQVQNHESSAIRYVVADVISCQVQKQVCTSSLSVTGFVESSENRGVSSIGSSSQVQSYSAWLERNVDGSVFSQSSQEIFAELMRDIYANTSTTTIQFNVSKGPWNSLTASTNFVSVPKYDYVVFVEDF